MIEIENLHFSYGRRHSVSNGLDFSLRIGHIYGLLGKNGHFLGDDLLGI